MLVEHAGTVLVVDAGLSSQVGLARALADAGRSWGDVDAVLVSHLHADHIHPAAVACCARHEVPIVIHEDNLRPFSRRILARTAVTAPLRTFAAAPFPVGSIEVRPFVVPHDAEGVTCGFRLAARAGRREVLVSVATDLGHGGNGLFEEFLDSDLIFIESNYDAALLAGSRRHDRARVGSDAGHLSNEQAGKLLARIMLSSERLPRAVVLCHLSADHNSPSRAVATVREILSDYGFAQVAVHAARRDSPSPRFVAEGAPPGE